MKTETISGALIAAAISFINALVALYLNDPELTWSMIKESAWIGMIGGATLQFLKDYQALNTRKAISKLTGGTDATT